jgi:hypothetical protein
VEAQLPGSQYQEFERGTRNAHSRKEPRIGHDPSLQRTPKLRYQWIATSASVVQQPPAYDANMWLQENVSLQRRSGAQ